MTRARAGVLLASLVLAGGVPAPASSQTRPAAPTVSVRPFLFVARDRFQAGQTFEAVFGSAVGTFWGGGAEVTLRNGVFVDLSVSRFRRSDGQRVLRVGGQNYPLGIGLTATVTPVEVTAGYRFRRRARLAPYVGAGLGTYQYQETSVASEPADNASVRHGGVLLVGGVEWRAHRWVGLSADVQYTHVGGILGEAGLSQAFAENDLGGVAGRLRLLIGR